ncbi:MAG: ORF6N domain-containing protein [Coriobacteriales bacterium]|nr:ORF6N domain-containing protein [Coriobacteriales bacterium]
MGRTSEKTAVPESTGIARAAIIDEETLRDHIHEIRGQKVMLDFELAEIYGYSTKRFNEQVKNNIEKFDEDFMFQLTDEETAALSRSKKSTLNASGRGSNFKYNPYAFTEQGVYMLMTVLRGELATRQSKALVRLFKQMKDYVVEAQGFVTHRELLHLVAQVTESTSAIRKIEGRLDEQEDRLSEQENMLAGVLKELSETVKRSEISPVLFQFELPEDQREFLLMDGCAVKADVTYIDLYGKARKSVYIIDNYISIKTLHLLQDVKPDVEVTVFSDNLGNRLHAHDYADFRVEFPYIPISFVRTDETVHDRFIVLDYGEDSERIFHCGASSKDAAVRLTTVISELTSPVTKTLFHVMVDRMRDNPPLTLR